MRCFSALDVGLSNLGIGRPIFLAYFSAAAIPALLYGNSLSPTFGILCSCNYHLDLFAQ